MTAVAVAVAPQRHQVEVTAVEVALVDHTVVAALVDHHMVVAVADHHMVAAVVAAAAAVDMETCSASHSVIPAVTVMVTEGISQCLGGSGIHPASVTTKDLDSVSTVAVWEVAVVADTEVVVVDTVVQVVDMADKNINSIVETVIMMETVNINQAMRSLLIITGLVIIHISHIMPIIPNLLKKPPYCLSE